MKKAIGIILAALMIGTTFFAVTPFVVSAEATLPALEVGDGWYFGKTWDFSDLQEQINENLTQALQELPGFEADVDVAGGVGLYMGAEVIAVDTIINGNNCYNVKLTGGLGVDFGLDATVTGSMNNEYMNMNIDAEAHAVATGELTLDGNIYFTVDKLAFAKADITLEMNADVQADINADIQMSTSYGGAQSIDANIVGDLSVVVDSAQINGVIECNPPLDIFNFPIYEGKYWAVPGADTAVTASLTGAGTITMDAVVTGIAASGLGGEDVNEHQTINLATEIGSQSGSSTIYYGTTWFNCVAVYGNNYIIETDTGEIFNYIDMPGTRQLGIDPTDLIEDAVPSSAGFQFNSEQGFVTGVTMDGEVETTVSDKTTVENFAADPQGQITAETGGAGSVGGGGGGLFIIIILLVVVIVVVFVVVALVVRGKKKGPEAMYGAPPGQQYPQQQQYQQPPPQQQPPQGQYPPPPPPPPQGGY